jgi:hypothetical protein
MNAKSIVCDICVIENIVMICFDIFDRRVRTNRSVLPCGKVPSSGRGMKDSGNEEGKDKKKVQSHGYI